MLLFQSLGKGGQIHLFLFGGFAAAGGQQGQAQHRGGAQGNNSFHRVNTLLFIKIYANRALNSPAIWSHSSAQTSSTQFPLTSILE